MFDVKQQLTSGLEQAANIESKLTDLQAPTADRDILLSEMSRQVNMQSEPKDPLSLLGNQQRLTISPNELSRIVKNDVYKVGGEPSLKGAPTITNDVYQINKISIPSLEKNTARQVAEAELSPEQRSQLKQDIETYERELQQHEQALSRDINYAHGLPKAPSPSPLMQAVTRRSEEIRNEAEKSVLETMSPSDAHELIQGDQAIQKTFREKVDAHLQQVLEKTVATPQSKSPSRQLAEAELSPELRKQLHQDIEVYERNLQQYEQAKSSGTIDADDLSQRPSPSSLMETVAQRSEEIRNEAEQSVLKTMSADDVHALIQGDKAAQEAFHANVDAHLQQLLEKTGATQSSEVDTTIQDQIRKILADVTNIGGRFWKSAFNPIMAPVHWGNRLASLVNQSTK
jgi:hypothetical protein